jgi:hypothetical protein
MGEAARATQMEGSGNSDGPCLGSREQLSGDDNRSEIHRELEAPELSPGNDSASTIIVFDNHYHVCQADHSERRGTGAGDCNPPAPDLPRPHLKCVMD